MFYGSLLPFFYFLFYEKHKCGIVLIVKVNN